MIPVQAKFVGGVICAIFSLIGKVLFFLETPSPLSYAKMADTQKFRTFPKHQDKSTTFKH